MGRWRDIEPDNVVELLGEGVVVGQLEAAPPVRCKAVIVPDFHGRRGRNADRLGHRAHRPMRSFGGRRLQRQLHHPVDHLRIERSNAQALGCQQNDPRTPDMLLRRTAPCDDCLDVLP